MMSFKNIQQNYPVYILDKQELKISQGKVVRNTFPHIDVNNPNHNPSNIIPSNPTGAQMVVDVTIEVNGKTATYVIPENDSVAFAGNIVLSTDRDGLVREVEAMKNNAEKVLSTVEYQKSIVEKSSELLAELNPAYKEKMQTEERLGKMESSVGEMKDMMKTILEKLNKNSGKM